MAELSLAGDSLGASDRLAVFLSVETTLRVADSSRRLIEPFEAASRVASELLGTVRRCAGTFAIFVRLSAALLAAGIGDVTCGCALLLLAAEPEFAGAEGCVFAAAPAPAFSTAAAVCGGFVVV